MRVASAWLLLILSLIVGSVFGFERASLVAGTRDKSDITAELLDETEKWGGEGIVLTTGKDWASIEFGCARATIPGGIKTLRRGKFSLPGIYTPGTAIRTNETAKSLAIRADGQIVGKQMSLKLTNLENKTVIGTYTLERGKRIRLSRCM